MEGNREGVGRAGLVEQPRDRRRLAVALILAVLAILLVLRAWVDWRHSHQVEQADADYTSFMAAVHQAEDIADPLQRCLHYPSLPGAHWHDDTTRAYCRLRNLHSLSRTDIAALLAQGKAGDVNKAFQGCLDAQLHDPSQPGVFDAAFYAAGFDHYDANTRKLVDQWKQQTPDSAFALIASGMQYLDAAQQARGFGWSDDLTDSQRDGMEDQVARARNELSRAVSLLPTATPAYRSMIYASALTGDYGSMYQAAETGLKVDPANYGIRSQMMNQAQPKWGHMFGGERKQKREAEALVARNPLLRMVTSLPAVYSATCNCGGATFEYVQKVPGAADDNVSYLSINELTKVTYDEDPRLTIELYSESLRFHPTDPDVLRWRAQLMMKLGDPKGALESILQMAQHFPGNNDVALALANIYNQTGHVKESEDTYEAILQRDPDHQKAMAWLGDLYNHAGHQPEKAKALADRLISNHPDNPEGYIVRSCYLMDHDLPGRYETIHYFIDHFGDRDEFKSQVAEMRAYLAKHPEKIGQG